MKRRIKLSRIGKIGVVLTMVLSVFTFMPQAVEAAASPESDFTFDGAGKIIAYTGNDSIVVIPDKIQGISVTTLGNAVFTNNRTITNVTIPSSVTTIEHDVTSGIDGTFGICANLEEITIEGPITRIPDYTFNGCASLTTINTASPITSVGDSAFSGCRNLTTINLGVLTSIGDSSFNRCNELSGPINLGSGITSIPNSAFNRSYALTAINNASPITSVGVSAFEECISLTTIDLGVLTSIGKNSFAGCFVLPGEKIKLAESITAIPDGAFGGCSLLTNITLPSNLQTIGDNAFAMCSLSTIELPDSVISVGNDAFLEQTINDTFMVDKGVSTYTFPTGIDTTKVTVSNTSGIFDLNTRTISVNGLLTDFEYSYTLSNMQGITAPLTAMVTLKQAAAEIPNITTNLNTHEVKILKDGTALPLSVDAIIIDGGTLSYQWYKNTTNTTNGGTAISSATSNTYTPPTNTIGTTYYYCEITNTNTNVATQITTVSSNIAKIKVIGENAETPTITNDLSTSEVKVVKDTMASALDATATVTDGGTLSYQWYSNTTATVGGTPISGATSATYTPPTSSEGTTYYYCEVTNTNNSAINIQVVKTTSTIAMITTIKEIPVIIEGKDQVFIKGSLNGLLFVSSADFADFIEIQIDEQVVDSKYYEAKSGSTRVTLKPEYLETLTVGTHTLAIVSRSGKAEATFVIKDKAIAPNLEPEDPTNQSEVPSTPKQTEIKKEVMGTNDTSLGIIGLLTMLVVSGVSILGIYRKKSVE